MRKKDGELKTVSEVEMVEAYSVSVSVLVEQLVRKMVRLWEAYSVSVFPLDLHLESHLEEVLMQEGTHILCRKNCSQYNTNYR